MAVRETVTEERSVPGERHDVEVAGIRVNYYDIREHLSPMGRHLLETRRGKWRDRQSHGRLVYEEMLAHPEVAAVFETVLNFLKAVDARFVSTSSNPTPRQKEMAEFLNSQVERLASTGQANDGWSMLIDGLIGQGLEFGFALGELSTKVENHKKRPMTVVDRVAVFPQSSLDNGVVPQKELGNRYSVDPRYHCFDINMRGDITAVYQYRNTDLTHGGQHPDPITWTGDDLRHILHFKHKGGDGNPFGESLFYAAFDAWSKLYLLEEIEMVHLSLNAVPFMTVSRDADNPSPQFNEQIKDAVEERGEFNLVVANRAEFGSWTAANEAFTKHIKQAKDELRQYIAQVMGVPRPIFQESNVNEQNFRDMLIVFLKYRLPALAKSIAAFMTWQFGRRLIDSNYRDVDLEDYPRFEFDTTLDSDIKEAIPVLQQVLNYVDSERLGEVLSTYVPGFKPEWIPEKFEDSVEVKRPKRDANDEPNSIDGSKPDSKANPPSRTGERGNRQDDVRQTG